MALYLQHTTVPAEKSVADIQRALAAGGATAVLIEYDGGRVHAVSFRISVDGKQIPFRLPCRWQAVATLLKKRTRTSNQKDEDDARRIAWRQILYWIKAQLALVDTRMVDFQEVFLPYVQLSPTETAYDRFKANGMKALPSGESERR